MTPDSPARSGLWLPILCATPGIWLGFPNDLVNLPLLVLLWPASLGLLSLRASGFGQAMRLGWLATFPGMCLALYWLSFPVRDVGGLPWPGAVCCALLISACLAVQGALFTAILRIFLPLGSWLVPVAGACLWYLLEWVFAHFPAFPWLPVAGALAPWPVLVQLADTLGAYLAGAVWAALGMAGMLALAGFFRRNLLAGIATLVICCAIAGYGCCQLRLDPWNPEPDDPDSCSALFVEGNVEQNRKWLPDFQRATLDLYTGLSMRGLKKAREQGISQPLIIWPETALPFFYERDSLLRKETQDFVAAVNAPLLFGAPGIGYLPGSNAEAVFNRAFLLAPDGGTLGVYDKVHLVPFGEYLPDLLKLDFLSGLLQGVGVYEAGQSAQPLRFRSLALGMLICYEAIFPWLARERVEAGANILVDISNDGWFRDSPAPRQHLYLGVLRSLEQNRWLLRATNTGISAVSDPRGRITLCGPQFTAGFLLAKAKQVAAYSNFYHIGHLLPPFAGAILVLLAVLRLKVRKI